MAIQSNLRTLFEPIKIGKMLVKNRIAMSPMGTGFATKDGLVSDRTTAYYETRARGGAGLIIVECSCVDFPRGIHSPNRLIMDNDRALSAMTKLTQAIKRHGSKAAIQLFHAGRMAKPDITGMECVGPSPIRYPGGSSRQGAMPRELTIEEINEIVALFAQAALRAKMAGFDGVEIHAGHGYLLASFLSPYSNVRKDSYGGSIQNRARILIEILKAIRKNVGDDYPLWCRINGKEYGTDKGLTLDDSKAVAQMIVNFADAIHITVWGYEQHTLAHLPDEPGKLLPIAEKIKEVLDKPVIAVGHITPELGAKAIEEGKADMIALGRSMIADPEFPFKVLSGKFDDIRPCIGCFHCLDMGVLRNSFMQCAVNAAAGKESDPEYNIRPAEKIKSIAIIGGGPGGMEAARVLSTRGHKVVLFEKDSQLGGQLNLASTLSHKKRINPLVQYLTNQLEKLGVEIRLKNEASVAEIRQLNPNVIILATGATPVVPQFSGVNLKHVQNVFDLFSGKVVAGQKVVVVGGGATGCEAAEFLYEKGKEVTVVEMLPELASDLGFRDRVRLLLRINDLSINFLTKTRCKEIRKDIVIVVTEEGQELAVPADTVIIAVGAKPNLSLLSLLEEAGFQTYLIGDCRQSGTIANAIGDAFKLGCNL